MKIFKLSHLSEGRIHIGDIYGTYLGHIWDISGIGFVLNMTVFVLNMTVFVLNMAGFVLKTIGFVLNITESVQNMAEFALNMIGFFSLS